MTIEVDQSIKIERTHKDTIIGLANKKDRFACSVSRQAKRKLQLLFRSSGQSRLFVYRTFIAVVVLSIKKTGWGNISDVVIDLEYTGQEQRLRSIFLEMWSRDSKNIPNVSFRKIGKRSQAHHACYDVTIRQSKADAKLNFGEVKRLAFK